MARPLFYLAPFSGLEYSKWYDSFVEILTYLIDLMSGDQGEKGFYFRCQHPIDFIVNYQIFYEQYTSLKQGGP